MKHAHICRESGNLIADQDIEKGDVVSLHLTPKDKPRLPETIIAPQMAETRELYMLATRVNALIDYLKARETP